MFVLHAGIETMNNAGPLEATAVGAKFGPIEQELVSSTVNGQV